MIDLMEEATRTERYLLTGLVGESAMLPSLAAKIKDAGTTVVKTEELGTRRLAFPIQKKHELQLISIFFEAEPTIIPSLERSLRQENELKRFLLTKWAVDPNEEPRRRRNKVEAVEGAHVQS